MQGYYRKGAALEGAGRLDEALMAYKEAAELEPSNSEFSIKIKNISRQIRASKSKTFATQSDHVATNGNRNGSIKNGPTKSDKQGNCKTNAQNGVAGGKSTSGTIISTDEEYAAALAEHKQNSLNSKEMEYNESRIFAWGRAILDDAMSRYVENDGKIEPTVMFLSGKTDAAQEQENNENKTSSDASDNIETAAQVSIKEAFESPDTLSNCVEFLRKYADDMGMHAAAVIVPRKAIGYPQVWKGLGAKQWKNGARDGFFVQLESKSDRRVWFVPTQNTKLENIPTPT